MKVLPITAERLLDPELRNSYIADVQKWGFDVAYSSLPPHLSPETDAALQTAYTDFVAQAHHNGLPACIQIPAAVCAGPQVSIEEAQYDLDNNHVKCGESGFRVSFASDVWLAHIKLLITTFLKQFGFDWVVIEESAFWVDVPGSKDRFYQKFFEKYPDVQYPMDRTETAAYLLVQKEKSDMLVGFCRELAAHAKSIGAARFGIMPWFFTPTGEDGLSARASACDLGRVAQLPDVDLVVARMQPSDVHSGLMQTGDDMNKSPELHYVEVMAHSLGKAVLTLTSLADPKAVPFEFRRDAALASLAAVPNGFVGDWYYPSFSKDAKQVEFVTNTASFAERLGQPRSPVAFVFSEGAAHHVAPLGYAPSFGHYWALARQMFFVHHLPMLTFHAETLERNLQDHPEVQVLVFEEHFPLTVDQMLVIKKWWQGPQKHAIVAFGSGLGFSADHNQPGRQPISHALPGVLELIGLNQEKDPQLLTDEPLRLRDVSRVRRSAFLEDCGPIELKGVANIRRIFGSRATVLYEADVPELRVPVVAEWRDRLTLAMFCGFELSRETAAFAGKAVQYALREVDAPQMLVVSCSDGLLWNINRNDYLVLSNVSDNVCSAAGRPGRATLWDCKEQKMLPEGNPEFKLDPHTFQVYRVVGRRSKFFDIMGASHLGKVIDGAGRADIELLAGKQVVLVLRASPKEVQVDGRNCTISQEFKNGAYHVTLNQCPPGEHHIALKW